MTDSAPLAPPRFVDRLEDCFFYHAMDLPGFGLVRGHWDLREKFDDYVGGVPMAGKSVLDVGTATGFLSFEAEKKGASRVLSFDQRDGAQQTSCPSKTNPTSAIRSAGPRNTARKSSNGKTPTGFATDS